MPFWPCAFRRGGARASENGSQLEKGAASAALLNVRVGGVTAPKKRLSSPAPRQSCQESQGGKPVGTKMVGNGKEGLKKSIAVEKKR
jgi:hypothetical protein